MMKMFCDKCSEEVLVPGGVYTFLAIPNKLDPKSPQEPKEVNLHLCMKCASLVTQFIKPNKV
jgi:hypothetical protein